ncbi:MAG: Two component regulator three Y domain protein [Flavobacteriaceae bacterium]|nr:Two component regulator three Y domain protein [Flavobacteriaceae bacterium]
MKNIQLTIVFTFLSFSLFAQISTSEKQALQDLYTSTNGNSWNTTWDLNQPVSDWHGVTIKDDKVIIISLLFNNLEGTIPNSIGQLTNLENLELSFNKLEGTIPSEIGNLKSLKVLAFNGNNLFGSIPTTIGNLSSLNQLHLSSNQLTGTIPQSVTKLEYLEILNVFDNDLSGEIPSDLAHSKNLKQLIVAENNLKVTNDFSIELLSHGASLDLEQQFIIPETKEVIAIESEEEN